MTLRLAVFSRRCLSGEKLFFELAIQDLTRAADLFASIHERTAGNDGFVSLEVSPRAAHDTKGSVAEATRLHQKANRPNLFNEQLRERREEIRPSRGRDWSWYRHQRHASFFLRHDWDRQQAACVGGTRRIAACLAPESRHSIRSLGLPKPLGRRNDGKSPRPTTVQVRHCDWEQQADKADRHVPASDCWQVRRTLRLATRDWPRQYRDQQTRRLPTSSLHQWSPAAKTTHTMPRKASLALRRSWQTCWNSSV